MAYELFSIPGYPASRVEKSYLSASSRVPASSGMTTYISHAPEMPPHVTRRIRIYSYSHKDVALRVELDTHLALLKREA